MAGQQSQGGGGGGGSSNDSSMTPAWLTVFFLIALYFIWKAAHQYIVAFFFKLNILQAKLVMLFVASPSLADSVYIMETIDPATVSWNQFIELSTSVGDYIRYPVIVFLVCLALILYRSNITLKYRKAHDMKTLRNQEQYNWTAIMPIVSEDLANQDINKGPWAMALTPFEFAEKHHLLKKDDALLDNQMPGLEFTAGIRKSDAKRVFTLQLGPYFEDFFHCSAPAAALAAVFMARINRDKDAANMILTALSKGYVSGKLDFSIAQPILKKYKDTKEVQEIISQHAYLLTVLASLLEAARDDGVVPSVEFLWLKTVDRRLWYMLNSVGRQTPFVEVGGPFAHWKAEKAMKRRSLMPMIDEATKALEIAVKGVKLSPKALAELKP